MVENTPKYREGERTIVMDLKELRRQKKSVQDFINEKEMEKYFFKQLTNGHIIMSKKVRYKIKIPTSQQYYE